MNALTLVTILVWILFLGFTWAWGNLTYRFVIDNDVMITRPITRLGNMAMMFGFVTIVLSLATIIAEFNYVPGG